MKSVLSICLVIGTFFLFVQSPIAGELQEEYKKLEIKRKTLEKQRKQYEARVKALSLQRQRLTSNLFQCISKDRKGDRWESKLNQAESTREKLETERLKIVNLRVDINKVRGEFENTRAMIESTYKIKTPGSEYETEFRRYMNGLDDQYFSRLEKELFKNYENYLSKIESYLIFLKNSIKLCK
ncbi:MAG: hypothetical protein GY749_02170 [Desulfobacteraceae bacterium]|nr:hypothetical protein [Desulfobacteraceae bacterium]